MRGDSGLRWAVTRRKHHHELTCRVAIDAFVPAPDAIGQPRMHDVVLSVRVVRFEP